MATPIRRRITCSVAESTELTGLGRTKLYELIGTGELASRKVGRRRLVEVQSLAALGVPSGRPRGPRTSKRPASRSRTSGMTRHT